MSYLDRKCVPASAQLGLLYEQAAVTTFTDFVLAAIPVPLLYHAKMNMRAKVSVGLILGLGAAGSICSIVRFFYVKGLVNSADFFCT